MADANATNEGAQGEVRLTPTQETMIPAQSVAYIQVHVERFERDRFVRADKQSLRSCIVDAHPDSPVCTYPALYDLSTPVAHVAVLNGDTSPIRLAKGQPFASAEVVSSETHDMADVNKYFPSDPSKCFKVPPKGNALTESERKTFLAQFKENDDLTKEQRRHLEDLLCSHHDIFSRDQYDIGKTNIMTQRIRLKPDATVFNIKQFPIPWSQEEYLKKWAKEMLDRGVIEYSRSQYNSPIFLVKKKGEENEAKTRVITDLRHLNYAAKLDSYSIKDCRNCLDSIGRRQGACFSALDLSSAFFQLPLEVASRKYTAFTIPGFGKFQYKVAPMGYASSPLNFAMMIDIAVRGLPNLISYIDDLLVVSTGFQSHTTDLEQCFNRLRYHGLKLNGKKCVLATKQLEYLGFKISKEGIEPGTDKLAAVKQFKPPSTVRQVREFIGLANYFRDLIPNFSHKAGALTALTKKDSGWKGPTLPAQALAAFHDLQKALCTAPVVAYPSPDRPLKLVVDAATGDSEGVGGGLGATLIQEDVNGKEHVVCYASRQLKKHEKNYTSYLLELQACAWSMTHFHTYLYGRRFELHTDHAPLTHLSKASTKTLNRLQYLMNVYSFTIHFKKGDLNTAADALSRNPIELEMMALAPPDFAKLQQEDSLIKALFAKCTVKTTAENANKDIAREVKRLLPCAVVKKTLVYIQTDKGMRLMVPESLRMQTMDAAHKSMLGGHAGKEKMLDRLYRHYYWPYMSRDVAEYLRQCLMCQRVNAIPKASHTAPMVIKQQATGPNQCVYMDLMGPLKSDTENKYVLLLTDSLTKYCEMCAIPNKEAATVVNALFDTWVANHGSPVIWRSDNGREFCNQLNTEFCKRMNISQKTNSPFHPQANAAERYNRTAIKYLRTILDDHTTAWQKYLPVCKLSLNTQVSKSTSQSPFFSTRFYHPRLPYFDLDRPEPIYGDNEASAIYLRLRQAWRRAREHNEVQTLAQKKQYDKKTIKRAFLPGDRVLVHSSVTPPLQNRKFWSKWRGPYVVLRVFPNVENVEVQAANDPTSRKMKLHVNRVRLIRDETLVNYYRGPGRQNARETEEEEKKRINEAGGHVFVEPAVPEGDDEVEEEELPVDGPPQDPQDQVPPQRRHATRQAVRRGQAQVDDHPHVLPHSLGSRADERQRRERRDRPQGGQDFEVPGQDPGGPEVQPGGQAGRGRPPEAGQGRVPEGRSPRARRGRSPQVRPRQGPGRGSPAGAGTPADTPEGTPARGQAGAQLPGTPRVSPRGADVPLEEAEFIDPDSSSGGEVDLLDGQVRHRCPSERQAYSAELAKLS